MDAAGGDHVCGGVLRGDHICGCPSSDPTTFVVAPPRPRPEMWLFASAYDHICGCPVPPSTTNVVEKSVDAAKRARLVRWRDDFDHKCGCLLLGTTTNVVATARPRPHLWLLPFADNHKCGRVPHAKPHCGRGHSWLTFPDQNSRKNYDRPPTAETTRQATVSLQPKIKNLTFAGWFRTLSQLTSQTVFCNKGGYYVDFAQPQFVS